MSQTVTHVRIGGGVQQVTAFNYCQNWFGVVSVIPDDIYRRFTSLLSILC